MAAIAASLISGGAGKSGNPEKLHMHQNSITNIISFLLPSPIRAKPGGNLIHTCTYNLSSEMVNRKATLTECSLELRNRAQKCTMDVWISRWILQKKPKKPQVEEICKHWWTFIRCFGCKGGRERRGEHLRRGWGRGSVGRGGRVVGWARAWRRVCAWPAGAPP